MINVSKNRSTILCTLLYCSMLHTMETRPKIKPKNEWSLLECVQAREIKLMEKKLSSSEFDFMELARSYIFALTHGKKLTPNEEVRSDPFMQEAIKNTQLQRKTSLEKLVDIPNKKSRRKQIDETLIDQGKTYLICVQKIYPHLKPFIIDDNNLNILFFLINLTDQLDLIQDFAESYETRIDWNFCDEFGKTLLHIHAKEGNVEMVDYLLSKQMDCNKQTYYDGNPHKTPLHYAAEHHHLAIVMRLLWHECNTDLTDCFGKLPFHYVDPGLNGNKGIFEILLATGPNIDSTMSDGTTLLYEEVKKNNPDTVEYLLTLGANPNKKINTGHIVNARIYHTDTPMDLAIRKSETARFSEEENYEKNNDTILELLQEYSQKDNS